MEGEKYSSDVDLQEIELEIDYDKDVSDSDSSSAISGDTLVYPCAVLEGVTTKWEVEFLRNHKCDKEVSIPLYINFEGLILLLGQIELTMDYLLLLKYLDSDSNYKLEIHRCKDNKTEIDLSDINSLIKFIKL